MKIIKVIKEKLSSNNNSIVSVKCNTDLAEIFINDKKSEIYNLETNYNSKIIFNFSKEYSLHDPIVNLENKIEIEDSKNNKRVSLEMKPKICQGEKGVIIDEVKYLEEPNLSLILLNPILKEAQSIVNLKNFKVDGFSFTLS